ncbi:MAG: hypothetical protein KJO13_11145, partial [Gammaproteobacteria bacterium]|nr:hypothetical protein [Gammaproteobacteria bacterium]
MRNVRVTRISSSVILVALGICLPGFAINAFAQSEDATASADVEQVVDFIRDAYEQARKALERLPRERFETDSVLDAADYEGESIVRWFEQNTRWVPYRGLLRGSDGVLLDRTGNSLDRSLLLARLLEDAGYDARLAHGQLSQEAVDAVLSRASKMADESPPPEPIFVDEVMEAAARASGEAAALADLVGSLPKSDGRYLQEAAADHWWVEAQLDDGWTAV